MNNELIKAFLRVIPFIVIIIIIKIRSRKGKLDKIDLYQNKPTPVNLFFIWWLSFLLYTIATEFILYKFGLLEVKHWNHTLIPSIILITGAVILAPIAEELIFRSLLLEKLIQWKIKKITSILLQAFVFVLFHNFAYEFTVTSNISVTTTFIDAILFAYAKYETKSIYTSMLMHSTGNLIATLERFIF